MRVKIWIGVFAAAVAAAIVTLSMRSPSAHGTRPVHVILIGASIGQGWQLSEWPRRAGAAGFTAEAIAAWQFDKTEAVQEVLMRPARKFRLTRTYLKSWLQPPPPKPDIVILKECSSYFPGNLDAYRRSIRQWAGEFQQRNVQVILATVVPVSKTRAAANPGKQESLLEYNRWIREYAREQHLALLDLEAAMRQEGETSYLQDRFDVGDGTHLNAAAYEVLDTVLRTTLAGAATAQ
jgi:lysophospholipase L1-like esterase